MLGFDEDDVVDVLDAAFDEEEGFLSDEEALLIEKLRGNDGVAGAGLVFEADEDESFGGAGTLSADDVAGNANVAAMTGAREVASAPDIGERRADEGHWMRAGGEAGAVVVGGEALSGVHGREGGVSELVSQ